MDTLAHDAFFHVRVIIGIVTGLSVTRLLSGLARFVQEPERARMDLLHIGWAIYLLLAVILFWWFEFGLSRVTHWTFALYFFVLAYAALYFFTCAVLFPDKLDGFEGYRDYFLARRNWFYGLLAALLVVDLADSALKGTEHLRALGPAYAILTLGMAVLAVAAIYVGDRRYHVAFLVLALAVQVYAILHSFALLG